MLHQTDAELFAVIERQCGWDLAALKKSAPQLVKASVGADSVAEGVAAISSNDTAGKVEQTLIERRRRIGWRGRSWGRRQRLLRHPRPQRLQTFPRLATLRDILF